MHIVCRVIDLKQRCVQISLLKFFALIFYNITFSLKSIKGSQSTMVSAVTLSLKSIKGKQSIVVSAVEKD